MGITDILGAGESIAKPIDAIGNALSKIVTTDKDRLAADQAMELLRQQPGILQVEINKLQMQSASIFMAGWRPFIGWVGGISVGIFYIPQYVLSSYLWFSMSLEADKILPYPISSDSLMELIWLLLGFGVYHTVDRFKR